MPTVAQSSCSSSTDDSRGPFVEDPRASALVCWKKTCWVLREIIDLDRSGRTYCLQSFKAQAEGQCTYVTISYFYPFTPMSTRFGELGVLPKTTHTTVATETGRPDRSPIAFRRGLPRPLRHPRDSHSRLTRSTSSFEYSSGGSHVGHQGTKTWGFPSLIWYPRRGVVAPRTAAAATKGRGGVQQCKRSAPREMLSSMREELANACLCEPTREALPEASLVFAAFLGPKYSEGQKPASREPKSGTSSRRPSKRISSTGMRSASRWMCAKTKLQRYEETISELRIRLNSRRRQRF